MAHTAVEQLLYLMDAAFEEAGEESLMTDLRAVTPEMWTAMPAGAGRSIRQIAGHVAACKYMYDNFAFGDGQMSWNDPAGALGVTMEQVQSARSLDAAEPSMEAVI